MQTHTTAYCTHFSNFLLRRTHPDNFDISFLNNIKSIIVCVIVLIRLDCDSEIPAMDQNNVYKRPNPSDSDADLIKFQNLFLSEKSKNSNFQPAAKVVRLTNPGNEFHSIKEQPTNNSTLLYFVVPETSTSPKISQFAKKRGLQKVEPTVPSKNPAKLILGDVVEKLNDSHRQFDRVSKSHEAFPKACRIDRSVGLNISINFLLPIN